MLKDSIKKPEKDSVLKRGEGTTSVAPQIATATWPDLGGSFFLILKTLAIFLVSQVLAAVLVVSFANYFNVSGSESENWLSENPYASFFYTLVAEVMAVALVVLVVRAKKKSLASIGIKKPDISFMWRGGLGYLAFIVVAIAVSAVLMQLIPGLDNENQQNILGFDKAEDQVGKLLAFSALVVLAPIGEEILMRGYLYSGLRNKMRFVSAAITSSLLFGFLHIGILNGDEPLWLAGMATFLLSLVLAYLREKTGNIWSGVITHMLNNLIAFNLRF